jgi:Mrp family chromosome partitioning ATPase
MDRISKALELARAQREALTTAPPRSAPAASTRREPVLEQAQPAAAPAALDLSTADTAVFRSPIHQPDVAQLERDRILLPGSKGDAAAAYKMLRTQVLKRLDQLQANSLAVLSPMAGAGKTLTAINLAIAIAAEPGRTALLVDLDLRNPGIHRRFGYQPAVGIEDCLSGNRPARDAMFKVAGYDRLTVLPARDRVANSSELLADPRTAEMMTELRHRYSDRILVFDLPPVLQADDALGFSRLVQAGLLVVSEGRTRRDDVARSIQVLGDLTLVGTVLNGSHERGDTYY